MPDQLIGTGGVSIIATGPSNYLLTSTLDSSTEAPPAGPPGFTSTLNIIKAYIYREYADDDNCRAFFDAYNTYAQGYLDAFNALNLPIYPSGSITGQLLDWSAEGIWGFIRPILPMKSRAAAGPYNTFPFNILPYNGSRLASGGGYQHTSDDVYKRVISWHTFAGDGRQMNVEWFKRRIERFLTCVNGSTPNIDNTYNVSVTVSGGVVNIKVPTSAIADTMTEAIQSGALEVPFQYTYQVTQT